MGFQLPLESHRTDLFAHQPQHPLAHRIKSVRAFGAPQPPLFTSTCTLSGKQKKVCFGVKVFLLFIFVFLFFPFVSILFVFCFFFCFLFFFFSLFVFPPCPSCLPLFSGFSPEGCFKNTLRVFKNRIQALARCGCFRDTLKALQGTCLK